MREGPFFFAWCDEAQRVDAFGAALSALIKEPQYGIRAIMDRDTECNTTSVDEVVGMLRAHFGRTDAEAYFVASLSYEHFVHCILRGYTDRSERLKPMGPIHMHAREIEDFSPMHMDLALGKGPRSVQAEAVLAWHMALEDIDDVLLRLCAPDASGRVPTGGCTTARTWLAPVALCATYNADARDIARDLALSWLCLHDKERVSRIAGLPLEALRARVEAAPRGACVALRHVRGHSSSLSRETVLKALATPPSALLEALEAAAAAPDGAWRAAEPRAREIYERTLPFRGRDGQGTETGDGSPLSQVEITLDHFEFLVDHARFYVRRLPGGGVVLATHPYRTLWPLWSDALFALGLMS
ncbi:MULTISPECIES: hypothetical protein [Sorangium]|uniref:Uncharacterized protein n=1 Tax=Sorangium cellulosum TaxID=56 RepID=A0A4V0NH88_SORCE|nr:MULTISPECIES: hypothetical protein [Sorangium]AUX35822.1 hypothetical protein SOCE836_080210 [Sorangium cellulosum]WCQ95116.1 hypothetical protein NQZ70_07891 [Sorangium sp. Soce836]